MKQQIYTDDKKKGGCSSKTKKTKRYIATICIGCTILMVIGCSLFGIGVNPIEKKIDSILLQIKNVKLNADEIAYIPYVIKPATMQGEVTVSVDFDSSILSLVSKDNNGITIKGLRAGQSQLKVSVGNVSDTAIVSVTGQGTAIQGEKYIYSNFSLVELPVGTQSKINVSLYGGSISDVNGYTYSIEDPSIAKLTPSGQYCLIDAKAEGFTRIKVTHAQASYPYYINLLSFSDGRKTPFITTNKDVLTLKKTTGKELVEVSIKNATTQYSNNFTWTIKNIGSETPFSITPLGNKCEINPLAAGLANIEVTHPDIAYPLTILVRVVTIVDNVYIEPSTTELTLSGSTNKSISASLSGIEDYDNDEFIWEVDDESIVDIFGISNMCNVSSKKNGSTYITVSHPLAEYSRRILVVCKNQPSSAIDASHFITTTQNYIRTKVGDAETKVSIALKGGGEQDFKDFTWTIESTAKDGSNERVLDFSTTSGTVLYLASRSVSSSSCYGDGLIHPLVPGTATITISHPKAYYTTEIIVTVLDEYAVLEEPYFITSPYSILTMLYNTEQTIEASLHGGSYVSQSDLALLQWSATVNHIEILPNGEQAIVKAHSMAEPTTGYITISHPKAETEKKILVLMAETEEDLQNLKAIYTDISHYTISENDEIEVFVSSFGLEDAEDTLPVINWATSANTISVTPDAEYPYKAVIKGLRKGQATITVSSPDAVPCKITVTVVPEGTDLTPIGKPIYFTTSQNVVTMQPDTDKKTYVSALNMKPEEYQNITWTIADSTIATIIPNGESATIQAKKEGETIISVSHPDSSNTLKIHLKVGSQYVFVDTPEDVYISSSYEVLTLVKGEAAKTIQTQLVNSQEKYNFSFSIDKSNIAEITSFSDGKCFVTPIEAGQAEITVTHPEALFDKKILVVVANSQEELEGFSYLTTSDKVITITEGNNKTVSVSVANKGNILNGFTWESADRTIADCMPSGSTAIIVGNNIGTTKVTVSHPEVTYPVEFIVVVVDPRVASENPFITVSPKLITLQKSTSWTNIAADLVGGTQSDKANFSWTCNDSSVVQLVAQNEVARIRGLSAGMTTLTVTHPKAQYEEQVTIIIDDVVQTNCSISVPENLITMKPTDGAKTINATLVNGALEDRYNFSWSLDVYDVVDLRYSNNTASITPLMQGDCILTVSHPKSAYPQQIKITVSEYQNFGFGITSKSIVEGKSTFITMQVPASSTSQHIVYSVQNAAVAKITGTDKVCQLTGLTAGTTVVTAQLIATATNVVKASADLLVSVEEGASSLTYITANQNIYTMEKGTNKTLTASLAGANVLPTDNANLSWISSNDTIVKIRGASSTGVVTGQNVFVEAVGSGEATITVTHPKSTSDFTFLIIVPGVNEQNITLSKTYLSIQKGMASEIKATLTNAQPTDYKNIEWFAETPDGTEIVRIMGSGQTVTLLGVNQGTTRLIAKLGNGNEASCEIEVFLPRHISFEYKTLTVSPGQSVDVKYTYTPSDAGIQYYAANNDIFAFSDNDNGTVTITGLKEGNSSLTVITSYGQKDVLQIRCDWQYKFSIAKPLIVAEPRPYPEDPDKFIIPYDVNPANAEITVTQVNNVIADYYVDTHKKQIVVSPKGMGNGSLKITAKNPETGQTFGGTQTCELRFAYDNIALELDLIEQDGRFSYINNEMQNNYAGEIILGDGETVQFKVKSKQENMRFSVSSIVYTPKTSGSTVATVAKPFETTWSLTHPEDIIAYEYLINEAYRPVFRHGATWNVETNSWKGGTLIQIPDWKNEFSWKGDYYKYGVFYYYYADYVGLFSKSFSSSINHSQTSIYLAGNANSKWYCYKDDEGVTVYHNLWSKVLNPEEKGKIYTQAEFEAIPWYYCPGKTQCAGGAAASWSKGIMTNNVNATKRASSDTTRIEKNNIGTITITLLLTDLSKTQTVQFLVYEEVRLCTK